MADQFDTDYTHEPVCPYCGHKEGDAWEIDFGPGMDGDTTHFCANCGEEYFVAREVVVSYMTKKIEGMPT